MSGSLWDIALKRLVRGANAIAWESQRYKRTRSTARPDQVKSLVERSQRKASWGLRNGGGLVKMSGGVKIQREDTARRLWSWREGLWVN